MSDLDEALSGITLIRSQLAKATEFRGVGAATLAATGLIALLAGGAQLIWLEAPTEQTGHFIALWVGAALISVLLVGGEMRWRSQRVHGGLADAMILQAVAQFLPSGVIGALLTIVLQRFAPESLWLCPGLWQILFRFGFFASRSFLPPGCFAVGLWYMSCGLLSIAFAQGPLALSPVAMALPFAGGQTLLALVMGRRHGG